MDVGDITSLVSACQERQRNTTGVADVHKDLKKLLHAATGESGFVVAIFLDVRGFSSFARLAESSEAAVFLKRMYTVILDEYFPDAAFFKPTGDGLLIVLSYDVTTLESVANTAVRSSLAVLDAFPDFCTSDPMINFAVPQDLGIGLARGAGHEPRLKRKDARFLRAAAKSRGAIDGPRQAERIDFR